MSCRQVSIYALGTRTDGIVFRPKVSSKSDQALTSPSGGLRHITTSVGAASPTETQSVASVFNGSEADDD